MTFCQFVGFQGAKATVEEFDLAVVAAVIYAADDAAAEDLVHDLVAFAGSGAGRNRGEQTAFRVHGLAETACPVP